jgi:magnesium-transporting ATPase (P-type)
MIIAVKHGRVIFDNILKFIKYIMTGILEKSAPFSSRLSLVYLSSARHPYFMD